MAAIDSISAKQQLFVTAYLTPGLSIGAAAKVAGIGEKTAYRWLKLATVQAGIKQARAELYEQAMIGLLHLIEKSIQALDRNMSDNPLVPPSTQVNAARAVLEQVTSLYRHDELEMQLVELEEMIRDGRP